MKIFIKSVLCSMFLSLFVVSQVFAIQPAYENQKPTVAVITDINHRAGTIYLVTGASTDIIASDLITELNNSGQVYAPVLGDSMSKISKNLNMYTQTFFDEYKYNYNIDYVNLKRITQELNADYILMVTSGLDVQSNFLKDTIWNKLSIAGMDPVKPTYRLTTLITLLNPNTERILWQELYKKDITAANYDIGVVQFAPSYAQLSKIKTYSRRVAQHVTPIVNVAINPSLGAKKETRAIEIRKKDVTEDKRIYYPVIHKDKIKMPEMFQREPREPKIKTEPFIENVNNFTPKETNPVFDTQPAQSPVQYNNEQPSSYSDIQKEEQKPQLKPAVNVQRKQSLPQYEWNLKNIYDSYSGEQKGFWIFKKNRVPKIQTVTL